MAEKNTPPIKTPPERRGGWLSRFAPGVRKIVSRRDTPDGLWVKDPDTGERCCIARTWRLPCG